MHQLWVAKNWESATEAEVIAALLDPPAFIDPLDMEAIRQLHMEAIKQDQEQFYGNRLPKYAANPTSERNYGALPRRGKRRIITQKT